MKTIYTLFLIALSLTLTQSGVFSQEEPDTTLTTPEDTSSVVETDPVKKQILEIIKEVNKRSAEIDNIKSDGEIKVKTKKIDESGSIEIQAKKKDDVYFKIEGPLGIDAAEGHFNRKKFTFLDHLNDQAVTGSTTIINIGSLTKIRCTFDDLLNSFTGTVRIPKSKKDVLSMSEDAGQYIISMKRGNITRRYWIDKSSYTVTKYTYYGKSGSVLIQFEFSNFHTYGNGSYAKTIEIRRPKQGEYFKLKLEEVNLNQQNLYFTITIPSDYQRKVWK